MIVDIGCSPYNEYILNIKKITLFQQDTGFGAWMMMVAILSHELVITFSFGLRACRLFSQKKTAGIILFYTSTIPIGVGIGFGVYESGLRGHTVGVLLMKFGL